MGIHLLPPLYELIIAPVKKQEYTLVFTSTDAIDGYVGRSGGGLTWVSVHDGAGTLANYSGDTMFSSIKSHSSTNKWYYIYRAILVFLTNTIPVGAEIKAAKLSFYCISKIDELSCLPAIGAFSSNPASNTKLVAADYGTLGSTLLSNKLAYGNVVTGAVNEVTLNAAGRAAIVPGGFTKLGLREANYDGPNTPPPWSVVNESGFYIATIDHPTLQEPRLTVTYAI